MKESLRRVAPEDIDQIDEVNEDLFIPRPKSVGLRLVNRLIAGAYRRELRSEIIKKCETERPDVLIAYKGSSIDAGLVDEIKRHGILTVNIFPDCSPHVYSPDLKEAVGHYDLVISTKAFHPPLWKSLYGYFNDCEFVPHGYDPIVHERSDLPSLFEFDIGMAATWRPSYHSLIQALAAVPEVSRLRVAIAGSGWSQKSHHFPPHWEFPGEMFGMAYANWVRRSKIVLAPLSKGVRVTGVMQPGDEDTTRTYELAAAHCFFIHRRTPLVQQLFDEVSEVPMFDDAPELACLIQRFLSLDAQRAEMEQAAHKRAVPAYSTDSRARTALDLIRERLKC
jgi:glycosyltransferase involved in cell wall biosynthesis